MDRFFEGQGRHETGLRMHASTGLLRFPTVFKSMHRCLISHIFNIIIFSLFGIFYLSIYSISLYKTAIPHPGPEASFHCMVRGRNRNGGKSGAGAQAPHVLAFVHCFLLVICWCCLCCWRYRVFYPSILSHYIYNTTDLHPGFWRSRSWCALVGLEYLALRSSVGGFEWLVPLHLPWLPSGSRAQPAFVSAGLPLW